MELHKLSLVSLILFFATVPCLRANDSIGKLDDVWKKRQEEAWKNALEAYEPHPELITSNMNDNVQVSLNETVDVDGKPGAIDHHLDADDHDDEDHGHGHVNGTVKRKLTGRHFKRKDLYSHLLCIATNPIDRCWRCRSDWSDNRERLAGCAQGFGRKTVGGKGGRIYVVTDNSDHDVVNPRPGTLRWGVIQKEPLWIIFAHDMHIKLTQELMVNSKKTIDGRGANIHIAHGAGITLQFVNDVIIHNIHVHHIVKASGGMIRDSTDHYGLRGESDGDGISLFGATNVWIDHVSMSACADGLIDAIMGSTAVTISNCHFTHHNDVILLGASDAYSQDTIMQVTVAFNHFGKELIQRMPRCRWGFVHVVNNDYTHWQMYAIGGSMHPTIISQGNRFIAPDEQRLKEVTKRDYAPQSEWSKWIWKSEGDLFMNGAFFVGSGPEHVKLPYGRKDLIKAKPATFVRRLTRFAGAINCDCGVKC